MKKELYMTPELEVIRLATQDVITTSGEDPLPDDGELPGM